jgi:hypothetical protein
MRIWVMLAAFAALLIPHSVSAQSLKSDEIYSSIAVRTLSEPNPVMGADGRIHLAYELLVVNPTPLFVTLDKVEIVDDTGKGLWAIEGDGLAAMTEPHGGKARTLSPGTTAVVLLDVSFGAGEMLPGKMSARVTATRQFADKDGKATDLPKGYPLVPTITFTGAATGIGPSAVVVEPPLRGKGWVSVNGCCDTITSHRGAVMAINGQLRVPERFAIDWVKLDDKGLLYTGDVSKLESYAYYGVPIYAAADGVVVNLYDSTDEQVPGSAAKGITTENIGGNMVVVDIGDGRFAFYAHLQRGSLKVKLGDKVKAGDVLGLLGNTGNSDAPHLHFHIMDGPSPLDANGLPFVLTRFTSQGVMVADGIDTIMAGKPAEIKPVLTGEKSNVLPLNNEVVDFE